MSFTYITAPQVRQALNIAAKRFPELRSQAQQLNYSMTGLEELQKLQQSQQSINGLFYPLRLMRGTLENALTDNFFDIRHKNADLAEAVSRNQPARGLQALIKGQAWNPKKGLQKYLEKTSDPLKKMALGVKSNELTNTSQSMFDEAIGNARKIPGNQWSGGIYAPETKTWLIPKNHHLVAPSLHATLEAKQSIDINQAADWINMLSPKATWLNKVLDPAGKSTSPETVKSVLKAASLARGAREVGYLDSWKDSKAIQKFHDAVSRQFPDAESYNQFLKSLDADMTELNSSLDWFDRIHPPATRSLMAKQLNNAYPVPPLNGKEAAEWTERQTSSLRGAFINAEGQPNGGVPGEAEKLLNDPERLRPFLPH